MRITAGLDATTVSRTQKAAAEWRIPTNYRELLTPNPRETLWQRIVCWVFLLTGVAYYFFIAKTEKYGPAIFMGHVKSSMLLALSIGALIYLLVRLSNEVHLGRGLKRLQPKVDNASLVRIQIRQDSTVTGVDEGFAWFSEGTLYYKGLQCVFRLNAEDVLPLDEWPKRKRPHVDAGKDPEWILLNTDQRLIEIRIKQIDPYEDFDIRRRSHRFNMELSKWLRERPDGSLEGILPPLDVHPGLLRSDNLRYEGVASGMILAAIGFWLLVLTQVVHPAGSVELSTNYIQFALGLAIFYTAVRFGWQQHLDLINRRAIFLEKQLSAPI